MCQIVALAKYLDCEPSELTECRHDLYGLTVFELGNQEYAIGTDEEADAAAEADIRDSLWAFNASFILSECGLPGELEEAIQAFQESKCESANEAILALVEKCCEGGVGAFAEAAVSADGRGHFLSSYDGEENEEGDFFIYRVN